MKMPLSFHILTSRESIPNPPRGPKLNSFMSIYSRQPGHHGNVHPRRSPRGHPKLKIACVEADPGWYRISCIGWTMPTIAIATG